MLPGAEIVPCPNALAVFTAMLSDSIDAAVIPIENSLAGSVLEFYDMFNEPVLRNAKILREHIQRIRHNLIARPGTNLRDIKQVFSHPIALAQCRNFFNWNPEMQRIEHYDTAGSVRMIMQVGGDPSRAAIASKQAAELYGGQILQVGIEDDPENYTRFLLVQYGNPNRDGSSNNADVPFRPMIPSVGPPDKMSMIFSLKNRPGALVEALSIFSKLEMNLTKIESRPIKGRPWEYMFYVDVLFPKSEAADEAMARLLPICETMIDLGRYKAAVLG